MAHIDLIAFVTLDQMDQAEELLRNGRVDVNARDASGRTALDYVLLPRLLEPSYCLYNEEGWLTCFVFACVFLYS